MDEHAAQIERAWQGIDQARISFRKQMTDVEAEWAALPPERRVSEAELRRQFAQAERDFEEWLDDAEWDIVDADIAEAKPPPHDFGRVES